MSERCITYGIPQLLAGYQSYYRFTQSRDAVVMATEMIHEARVVPLDGSPHLPPAIRQWLGDSRGHWEGDTLVIDTTNFKPRSFQNAGERLHLVERLTRVGPDTLHYEITIDDPETWEKPWTLMIPLRRSPDELFEYACHEGNSGMVGILAGARAAERTGKAPQGGWNADPFEVETHDRPSSRARSLLTLASSQVHAACESLAHQRSRRHRDRRGDSAARAVGSRCPPARTRSGSSRHSAACRPSRNRARTPS